MASSMDERSSPKFFDKNFQKFQTLRQSQVRVVDLLLLPSPETILIQEQKIQLNKLQEPYGISSQYCVWRIRELLSVCLKCFDQDCKKHFNCNNL